MRNHPNRPPSLLLLLLRLFLPRLLRLLLCCGPSGLTAAWRGAAQVDAEEYKQELSQMRDEIYQLERKKSQLLNNIKMGVT